MSVKMCAVKNRKQVSLDAEGLCLLGTALFLSQLNNRRWVMKSIRRISELNQQAKCATDAFNIEDTLVDEGLFPFTEEDLFPISQEMRWARNRFKALGIQLGTIEKAKNATISTFRFEWHHLYQHKILAVFLKQKLPRWADDFYSSAQLISSPGGSEMVEALERLLFDELFLLEERGFSLNRPPKTEDEIIYSLTVSDLCGDPTPDGRKPGTGYPDATEEAVAEVLSLINDEGLKADPATKKVLESYDIVKATYEYSTDGIMADCADKDKAFNRIYRKVLKARNS